MMSEKEFYQYLSAFIKTKRKEANYTNEDLAYSSKTDVSKISLLQNNKTGCNAYTLYKILLVLGVNIFNKEIKIPNLKKQIVEDNIKKLEEYIDFLKNLL